MDDWTDRWLALETRLAALLLAPREADFVAQLEALLHEARSLFDADADAALLWLVQVGTTSPVGYSAAHALVCWALARAVGPALALAPSEREALERAALTMNVGMTALQDALATQPHGPDARQRALIDTHAARSAQLLRECGVREPRWLAIVEHHHDRDTDDLSTRLLQRLDRYAALLSPRQNRHGRDSVAAMWELLAPQGAAALDAIGAAMLATLGVCPPGAFVRLHDGRVAVVLRRTERPAEPWVAPVLERDGRPIPQPQALDTRTTTEAAVEAALPAAQVRARIHHGRLLRLARALRPAA